MFENGKFEVNDFLSIYPKFFSLLFRIKVILFSELHPQKYDKTNTILLPDNYGMDKCSTSCKTYIAIQLPNNIQINKIVYCYEFFRHHGGTF